MEQEEIDVFELLKIEFGKGITTKRTVIRARNIYNKYTNSKIEYCMCTSVKRNVFASQFIEWYESLDR